MKPYPSGPEGREREGSHVAVGSSSRERSQGAQAAPQSAFHARMIAARAPALSVRRARRVRFRSRLAKARISAAPSATNQSTILADLAQLRWDHPARSRESTTGGSGNGGASVFVSNRRCAPLVVVIAVPRFVRATWRHYQMPYSRARLSCTRWKGRCRSSWCRSTVATPTWSTPAPYAQPLSGTGAS